MNIGTMEVLCDHIENVTPVKSGQDAPMLRLLLDDVDASGLMRQMVSMCDPEDLLDYFKDDVIREYLEKQGPEMTSEQYAHEASLDALTDGKL